MTPRMHPGKAHSSTGGEGPSTANTEYPRITHYTPRAVALCIAYDWATGNAQHWVPVVHATPSV